MNVGSTFSGVGGIDLGLERAGMRVLWNAEADEWCRGVLRHHWPDAVQYADVRDVAQGAEGARPGRLRALGGSNGSGDALGARPRPAGVGVDLLCGGFPCQDLSVAGRRAGLAGARSGLFHEYARIADALRPAWLLLENVPGLLSSNDGRDFGVLLGTLADLGYGVAWRVLDSRYFGVPQRRRRVFIVGRAGGDHASALRALCESCPGSPPAGLCSWQGVADGTGSGSRARVARSLNAGSRYDGDTEDFIVSHTLTSGGFDASEDGTGRGTPLVVAATLSKGSAASPGVNPPGRRQEDDVNLVAFHATQDPIHSSSVVPAMGHEPNGIANAAGVRRLTPRECERLQGFPDDWTSIPGQKCPDSRRYAAMGNAVTTNVAEWIGRRIHAIHLAPVRQARHAPPRPQAEETPCPRSPS